MSRSTKLHGKQLRTLCLFFELAAAAIALFPEPASAAGSSPFAGCYTAEGLNITINNSGRITDSNDFVDLRGRIRNDGYMEITYTFAIISFDPPRGSRRPSTYTVTALGYGDLDDDGNLYGVLQWSNGSVTDFLWLRCH